MKLVSSFFRKKSKATKEKEISKSENDINTSNRNTSSPVPTVVKQTNHNNLVLEKYSSIRFPSVRQVLWPRDATGAPVIVPAGSRAGLPLLHIQMNALRAMQEAALRATNNEFPRGKVLGFLSASVDPEKPGMLVVTSFTSESAKNTENIQIPVTSGMSREEDEQQNKKRRRATATLSFEKKTYHDALKQLRSSCTSLDGKAEHLIQMQCAIASLSSEKLSVRMEAVCPAFALTFTPVLPVRLVSTPLSKTLTTPHQAQEFARKLVWGFLTLDQTRKVVPLLISDPAASRQPLVGVWVRSRPSLSGSKKNFSSSFHDSHLWAACIRFLCNTEVRPSSDLKVGESKCPRNFERCTPEKGVFLVALIGADGSVQFAECRAGAVQRFVPVRGLIDSDASLFEWNETVRLDKVAMNVGGLHGEWKPVREPLHRRRFHAALDEVASVDGTFDVGGSYAQSAGLDGVALPSIDMMGSVWQAKSASFDAAAIACTASYAAISATSHVDTTSTESKSERETQNVETTHSSPNTNTNNSSSPTVSNRAAAAARASFIRRANSPEMVEKRRREEISDLPITKTFERWGNNESTVISHSEQRASPSPLHIRCFDSRTSHDRDAARAIAEEGGGGESYVHDMNGNVNQVNTSAVGDAAQIASVASVSVSNLRDQPIWKALQSSSKNKEKMKKIRSKVESSRRARILAQKRQLKAKGKAREMEQHEMDETFEASDQMYDEVRDLRTMRSGSLLVEMCKSDEANSVTSSGVFTQANGETSVLPVITYEEEDEDETDTDEEDFNSLIESKYAYLTEY